MRFNDGDSTRVLLTLKLDSSEAAPFTLRTTMTTTGKFKIKHNFHVSLST